VLGANEDVFADSLVCDRVNYMGMESLTEPRRVLAKIRYAHQGQFCTIFPEGEKIRCEFEEPVRAVTPGQAVVFYEKDYVLGGGTIL
jgi:tRNA-specific 2-thiouridylase